MNLTKTLAVIAAFAGLLCTSAQATPVNLVTNGGFETVSSYGQIKSNVAGWTTTGYNFVFAANGGDNNSYLNLWGPRDGSANGLGASPMGGNYIGADGNYGVGALTQTINGLVIGQSYNLSFYWAAAQQAGFRGLNTEQWIVSLGNQTLSTAVYNNADQGFSGWMAQTFTYTATSTSEVLSFLARGTPTGEPPFSLLDGVSLTANVPEPSSTALFLGGLVLLGCAVRARRRAGKAK